jgi:MFS family permease
VAFRLPMCALQFLSGKLYKLFPVKPQLIAGSLIFTLGTIICGAATSSKMIVFGRAIIGLACASIVAGCFTLLAQLVPLRLRSAYLGAFGAGEAVAMIAAPALGGVLTQKLSWRWCK